MQNEKIYFMFTTKSWEKNQWIGPIFGEEDMKRVRNNWQIKRKDSQDVYLLNTPENLKNRSKDLFVFKKASGYSCFVVVKEFSDTGTFGPFLTRYEAFDFCIQKGQEFTNSVCYVKQIYYFHSDFRDRDRDKD